MLQSQDLYCFLSQCGDATQRFRPCNATQVLSNDAVHLQKCLADSLNFTSPFHIQRPVALFILSHNFFVQFSDLDPQCD